MRWELPRRVVAAVEVALPPSSDEVPVRPEESGSSPARNRLRGVGPVLARARLDAQAAAAQQAALFVHHTDAQREWVYGRQSSIGRLDKGLDEARARGWTVVDMKRDWKVVFPFEEASGIP